MGNTIFIKKKRVCVKPLRSRLEVIQKLKPPHESKGLQKLCRGSKFCKHIFPRAIEIVKTHIVSQERKADHSSGEMNSKRHLMRLKSRLLNPPVLSMPDKRGIFPCCIQIPVNHATGSALYQVQNRKPKLIAYASKRMPEAARNYSITELEMCGLAINIASFAHLLKRVDFDAVVDHLAISHIMKSKMETATNRIKRLLEVLCSYSFNLYYIKSKDMILSDFLSRQIEDDSNPHEIIPISFNIQEILQESYHNIVADTY